MSTPVRLLLVAAVVVLGALAAAQWVQRGRSADPPAKPAVMAPGDDPVTPANAEETSTRRSADYAAVADRDLFRPLVSAPRAGAGAAGEGGLAGAQGAARTAVHAAGGPGGAPQPRDPLADMALTGVVQAGNRLQVLIESLSAKTGQYVALNQEYNGFRVVLIGPSSAVLERAGKKYTLTMGSRQMPEAPTARPAGPSGPTGGPAMGPMPSAAAPGGVMGAGGPAGFGGDMLSWAERQPLSELERMYGQYGRYLSPPDRARAEAYLESRRARERGQ